MELLSIITFKGKFLIQDAGREMVSVDRKCIQEWDKIKGDYIISTQLNSPQRLDTDKTDDTFVQLWIDASANSYSAVTYYIEWLLLKPE